MAEKARILIIRWSWFCDEVAAVFRELGHAVTLVERAAPSVMIPQVTAEIRERRPDVLFSVNFNPLFAEIAHKHKVPRYAAWNVDNLASSGFCSPQHTAAEGTVIFLIDTSLPEITGATAMNACIICPSPRGWIGLFRHRERQAVRDEGLVSLSVVQ
jgi:hypothetical protein